MPTVSVAMIAFNEAPVIAKALRSVAWAEEAVVIDCGSSDGTADIAHKAGAKVFRAENHPNLNINKNRAIDLCVSEWIFVLDADEWVSDELAGAIRAAVSSSDAVGWLVPRKNYALGKWLQHAGEFPDYQLRLFRKGKGRFPAVHIHERLKVDGKIGKLKAPLEHEPFPDIAAFIRKNLRDAAFEGDYLFARGRRITSAGLVIKLLLHVPLRFGRRYLLSGGFLDGIPGLIRACFDGVNQSLRWMRVWELTRREIEDRLL